MNAMATVELTTADDNEVTHEFNFAPTYVVAQLVITKSATMGTAPVGTFLAVEGSDNKIFEYTVQNVPNPVDAQGATTIYVDKMTSVTFKVFAFPRALVTAAANLFFW